MKSQVVYQLKSIDLSDNNQFFKRLVNAKTIFQHSESPIHTKSKPWKLKRKAVELRRFSVRQIHPYVIARTSQSSYEVLLQASAKFAREKKKRDSYENHAVQQYKYEQMHIRTEMNGEKNLKSQCINVSLSNKVGNSH